jgi:hypothetical protein
MSVFDLIFIGTVLGTIVAGILVLVDIVRGRLAQAARIVAACSIGAAVYLATGLTVSYFKPQHIVSIGEPWCFDDWCLQVKNVNRLPSATRAYKVDFRMFSRAGRVSQRASGAWVYLIDGNGRRYEPDSDPGSVPLDVLLRPRESVEASRVFQVAGDAANLGLITGHGGPYCGIMSTLIIGEATCLYNKPTMVRIE